jgi:beta-lactamase class A
MRVSACIEVYRVGADNASTHMHFSPGASLVIAETQLRRLAVEAGLDDCTICLETIGREGPSCCIEARDAIYPASMIKTPLAVAAAAAERDGRISWSQRLTVERANMTPNDAPSPLVPGAGATPAELLALMLSRSDNVATNMLIDRLDRGRASADLAALGFPATVIRRKLSGALPLIDDPQACGRNVHSARDACELFKRIALDDVPGAARIADALAAQFWNGKLSGGLAPGDRFAHKTGDTDEVSHDGGILTLASGERYALAVYTQLESNAETDRRFGVFMRALRPLLVRGTDE